MSDLVNHGHQYLASVRALAAAAGMPEDWATAVLARLASGPEVWLLVSAEELDHWTTKPDPLSWVHRIYCDPNQAGIWAGRMTDVLFLATLNAGVFLGGYLFGRRRGAFLCRHLLRVIDGCPR
jgi:hypothetical protein